MPGVILRMGVAVVVKAVRAFRAVEFMALAGNETEGEQDGEQGETFHRAPLNRFPLIGNPVSRPQRTFPAWNFLMRSAEFLAMICQAPAAHD